MHKAVPEAAVTLEAEQLAAVALLVEAREAPQVADRAVEPEPLQVAMREAVGRTVAAPQVATPAAADRTVAELPEAQPAGVVVPVDPAADTRLPVVPVEVAAKVVEPRVVVVAVEP